MVRNGFEHPRGSKRSNTGSSSGRLSQLASEAERRAVENARAALKAKEDAAFIAAVFSKAEAAEEGLALSAHRARQAEVRLEEVVADAKVHGITPLAPKEVAEASAVWVRGLPNNTPGAAVAETLGTLGGTVTGVAVHCLAKWELTEHERRRTDDMADLTTWGLAALSTPEEAAAVLDAAQDAFSVGGLEIAVCASDVSNHAQFDFDGALVDCWTSLHTLRVEGIPQDHATKKDLKAFIATVHPDVVAQSVTLVHHYDVKSGRMIGDGLVTIGPDLAAVAKVLLEPLQIGELTPSGDERVMHKVSMTDVAFEVESDLFYDDSRVRRCKERAAMKEPPVGPVSSSPKKLRESESNPDMFVRHEKDEVVMMLAEDSMKIEDWGAAVKQLERYLKLEPSSQKAAKMLVKAKKKQVEEKEHIRTAPRPKKVFPTGMWTMASPKNTGPPRKTKDEIAAGYMKRRRDREVQARKDFHDSKKMDFGALIGAMGGAGKEKPAVKMAFGRGKISMTQILNQGQGKQSLGKAGHAHLLNMSDGSVLKTGKKSREWDLAHSSVSDTISRARDEISKMMEKGENTHRFNGLDHPPRRPTEHLQFQLQALQNRGPANTAPRPTNQFGHQCVVPAFTQIEKIKKITDLCEFITITEPMQQEAAAAAIARAGQNMRKRREANSLMAVMRAEVAQRQKIADEKLAKEQAAAAAEAEAARLEALWRAAESPDTKEARGLFEQIDEDGGGTLDREEIRILAKRLGKRLSDEKLDAAMAQMDEDGNGDVDFEEFVKWWKAIGSKGFFGEVLSFGWLKKKKETETEEEKAEILKNEEETYFDTFKRERAETEERIEQQKMENDEATKRIMDNAASLQAVGSLGVAGEEEGKFATRMTGKFSEFHLGADAVSGQDRGRSLRVSTRAHVVGPGAKARTTGLGVRAPHPPGQGPPQEPEPEPEPLANDVLDSPAGGGSGGMEVREPEPVA